MANISYFVIIEVICNGSRTEISKSLNLFSNNKYYIIVPLVTKSTSNIRTECKHLVVFCIH